MVDEGGRGHAATCGVAQRAAELPGREAFPGHPQRRQVPIVSSGDAARELIGLPVTRCTMQACGTTVFRAARDTHEMNVSIVALARISSARMAVHAARRLKDGCHALEERGRIDVRLIAWRRFAICAGAQAEKQQDARRAECRGSQHGSPSGCVDRFRSGRCWSLRHRYPHPWVSVSRLGALRRP